MRARGHLRTVAPLPDGAVETPEEVREAVQDDATAYLAQHLPVELAATLAEEYADLAAAEFTNADRYRERLYALDLDDVAALRALAAGDGGPVHRLAVRARALGLAARNAERRGAEYADLVERLHVHTGGTSHRYLPDGEPIGGTG